MAQIFKAKTLVSSTGRFSHEATAPNLVYNTGDQTISGNKNFTQNVIVGDQSQQDLFVVSGNNISFGVYPTINGTGIVYTQGDQNISGIKTFASRPTVNGTGVLLSGEAASLPVTIVYTTGDQTISGLKDFTTRPTVNTTPVLLSGENANGITVLVKNDEPATLLKGQPVYIYGANGSNILVRKASNTGEAYSSKTLGLLAQDLTSNAQGLVITQGALEGINTNAGNAGDPIWLGPTGNLIFGLAQKPYAPNHLVYLGVIERKQSNNGKIYVKVQNGFELEELHNVNINHKNVLNDNDILKYNSASGLWFNETLNTGVFQTQINSLSGVSVLTFSNQTISGIKTFEDSIKTKNIISTEDYNLLISGSSTAMVAGDINITPGKSSFSLGKINLTAAGDQVDGNINFKGNIDINNYGNLGSLADSYPSGLGHKFTIYKSGANDYSKNAAFKSFEVNQTGVYTLNKTPIYSDGQIYISGNPILTGIDLSSYATTANLALTGSTLATNIASTGSTLQTNINNLSNTYATITNLALTGSTLNTKINNLSGYINSPNSNIVFTTGDQSISGIKTFNNDVVFTGTAIFNEIDLSDTDNILLSGVNIQIISGSITLTNMPTISGNPLITGVDLSSYLTSSTASATYATITNLASTGSTLQTNINNLSNTYATITNLALTGSTLDTKINNLSGVSVLTFGNQNIGGNKTFTGVTTFSGQEVNLVDIALNLSGVGDMTFSGTNINFINSPVFISGTNLRVAGDVLGNNLVYNTGNQTINGLKTFTSGIDIYSGTSPQSLRIFNSTGTNSGEFALIGWQPNLGIVSTGTNSLVIGTQSSNSGILRDVIITGENIALSPRSGRLYINGTSSLNDHLLQTSPCSGNITGYITGIGFTGNYTGNYEGGYFLGRTRLTQNTVQLVESSFGSNFIRKSTNAPTQAFRSLAVSSDGRYQITANGDYGPVVGYVYVSNDYGNTWTPRITDATRSWRGVAISADGKYQTACHYNGYIYVSNDYGNTWTAKDSVRYWATVAMSSDGKYQTATGGSLPTNAVGIYISNDYGNTWTLKQSSSFYVSITMSSDGKYQYAVENSSGNGNIYRSSDYGNTWTAIIGGALTGYTSIATSADGKFIIIGRSGPNTLLISNNYGASFVAKSISANYFSVAVSDNGKYMVAGVGAYFVSAGGIYFSSDYGNTWRVITPSVGVWTVAMSSNAKYVLGVNSSNTTTPVHIFKTDELIDGNLTINNNLTLPSGDFYSYNVSGVNSGEFGLIGWRNNQFVIGSQQSQNGILRDVIITGNNININGSGVFNIFDNTNIVGNLTVSGNTTITGHLSAASKSFLIDHPTQVGKKLQYGSLEGPEHGVFVRGKTNDNIINLPNYWPALVDENSISVNLTPISAANNIYVIDYNNSRIITSGNNRNDYFYTVYGERKDIPKLTVEF